MSSVMEFAAGAEADASDRIDAMHVALAQADAVLTLISLACHDTKSGIPIDQDTLSNAIWAAHDLVRKAMNLSGATT